MRTALADARSDAQQHALARARSLSAFYAAGGLLNLTSLVIPGWVPAHRWGLASIAAVALATALVLTLVGERIESLLCHVLLVFGSGLIAGCMLSAGAGSMTLAYAFFFTWVAIYAAEWFSGRKVMLHLGVALAAETGALLVLGGASTVVPACIVSMGACAAAAAVVHRLQARVRLLAERDPLTGAENRRGLNAVLMQYFPEGTADVTGTPLSLVALDLDGFKAYNDANGHAQGDVVLHACVAAWQQILGRGEVCARLGGDEFMLVCRRDDPSIPGLIATVRACVPEPLRVSVGAATASAGEDLASLLERADKALYLDKTTPRQRAGLPRSNRRVTSVR